MRDGGTFLVQEGLEDATRGGVGLETTWRLMSEVDLTTWPAHAGLLATGVTIALTGPARKRLMLVLY
jgi:hypothetical protein